MLFVQDVKKFVRLLDIIFLSYLNINVKYKLIEFNIIHVPIFKLNKDVGRVIKTDISRI